MSASDSERPLDGGGRAGGDTADLDGGAATAFERHVESAIAGRFDVLFAGFDGGEDHDLGDDGDGDPAELEDLSYKLLWVAADFGHAEAADMIDDLLEGSSLRYDDDRYRQGDAHFELGLAYLRGADGLPQDPEKGRAHLLRARSCHWPQSVHEGEALLSMARAHLPPRQLPVFDEVYPRG